VFAARRGSPEPSRGTTVQRVEGWIRKLLLAELVPDMLLGELAPSRIITMKFPWCAWLTWLRNSGSSVRCSSPSRPSGRARAATDSPHHGHEQTDAHTHCRQPGCGSLFSLGSSRVRRLSRDESLRVQDGLRRSVVGRADGIDAPSHRGQRLRGFPFGRRAPRRTNARLAQEHEGSEVSRISGGLEAKILLGTTGVGQVPGCSPLWPATTRVAECAWAQCAFST